MSVRAPGEIAERKLTPGQAADQWLAAEEAERDARALKNQAAAILTAHLQKTGKRSFKGLRLRRTGGNLVLDGEKVKLYLGYRLREFQKRQVEGVTLERV